MLKEPEHRSNSVSIGPQEQDACMASRWVGAKVRKPLIRRDEEPSLFLDSDPEGRVLPATHSLPFYSRHFFVSGFPKENGNRIREIFVDLEAHPPPLT
ncbi:MAG TPA: hypothetical protein VGM86_19110 [Thermoanaerobaculia bacterium]